MEGQRCNGCENHLDKKRGKCWFLSEAFLLYKKLVPTGAKPPYNQTTILYPICYRKVGYEFKYDTADKYIYANKIIQVYRGLDKMPIEVAYGFIACQLNLCYKTVRNVLKDYLEVDNVN
jgi:hypothetical protein